MSFLIIKINEVNMLVLDRIITLLFKINYTNLILREWAEGGSTARVIMTIVTAAGGFTVDLC